jgi:hypothetical protein
MSAKVADSERAVIVVGAGGLFFHGAGMLGVRLGEGEMVVVDGDKVEERNEGRQWKGKPLEMMGLDSNRPGEGWKVDRAAAVMELLRGQPWFGEPEYLAEEVEEIMPGAPNSWKIRAGELVEETRARLDRGVGAEWWVVALVDNNEGRRDSLQLARKVAGDRWRGGGCDEVWWVGVGSGLDGGQALGVWVTAPENQGEKGGPLEEFLERHREELVFGRESTGEGSCRLREQSVTGNMLSMVCAERVLWELGEGKTVSEWYWKAWEGSYRVWCERSV